MTNSTYWDLIYRRRYAVLLIIVVGIVCVFVTSRVVRPVYQATSSVMMVDATAGADPSARAADMPNILASSVVMERVKDRLHLPMTVAALRQATSGTIAYGSTVMQIAFSSPRPDLAVSVPNVTADEVVQYYREIAASRYDRLTIYLNQALAKERAHLQDLDRRLEVAAAQNSSVGTAGALDRITAQLDGLEQKRGDAEAALTSDMAAGRATAEAPQAVNSIVHQELIRQDPAYTQLRDKVAADSAQLALTKAQFTSKYPGLPELEAKVQLEQQQLAAFEKRAASAPIANSPTYTSDLMASRRADAVVSGDRARLAAIDAQIAQAHAQLGELPSTGVTIDSLRLDRDSAQAAYQSLTQRLNTNLSEQAEAASLGSVVVVDRAVHADTKGATKIMVPLAALTVLVLACSIPFLLELVDPRLNSIRELEALYGTPVLAALTTSR